MDQVIEQAKTLVNNQEPEAALAVLQEHFPENTTNSVFLQTFGEVLLETNDVETAYEVLLKSCELDPKGELGTDKFFYLGQIIGGRDGLEYLDVGLRRLAVEDPKSDKTIKKLNEGIFAKIDIWMTDLCMEPEAEQQCDDLISYSLELDDQNPETYCILASIRISQQQNDKAQQSVEKSWQLFGVKFTTSSSLETVELLQSLITLAKYAIELEMYDLGLDVLSTVEDINDNILEVYYLQTICHLFRFKLQYCKQHGITEDYRQVELDSNAINNETIADIKLALTNGYKLINSQDDLEPEIVDQINQLLRQFGGPEMSEVMPVKVNDDDDKELEDVDSD